MAEPYYTDAAALRTELGVDPAVLPDAQAVATIEIAEDLIDVELGMRDIDPDTGRKVVEADVQPWQWIKLGRATVKLAARIFRDPNLAGIEYDTMAGEVTVSHRIGPRFGEDVAAALSQSGLRVVSAGFGDRASRPPWYDFAYNVEDD